jgi:hypothetical protein
VGGRDGVRYYDRQGHPMSMDAWTVALVDNDTRRVAFTEMGNIEISTVWLGLDHNFWCSGSPLIFETMVFGGEYNNWQQRYCTEEQAKVGHNQVVAALRAGLAPHEEVWE